MIHTKILVCLTISLFSLNSFGQNNYRFSNKEKKNSIIFSPFNLIDPINPSLQIGYQRQLSDYVEMQLEYGYIINKALFHYLINPDESEDDYSNKGYKLRVEFKTYFRKEHFLRYYLSSELFYLQNVSKVQNQFIVTDPNYNYSFQLPDDSEQYAYTDYFTNSKTKYGYNSKLGMKAIANPIFFLNLYWCWDSLSK